MKEEMARLEQRLEQQKHKLRKLEEKELDPRSGQSPAVWQGPSNWQCHESWQSPPDWQGPPDCQGQGPPVWQGPPDWQGPTDWQGPPYWQGPPVWPADRCTYRFNHALNSIASALPHNIVLILRSTPENWMAYHTVAEEHLQNLHCDFRPSR